MANLQFDKEITALLVIDPYNDFISEGGKIWDRLKTVAEANDCVPHMGPTELKLRRDAIAGAANHPYDRFYVWNWQTYEKIAPNVVI